MADDLIVVVPGITGSALHAHDTPLWDLSVAAVTRGLAHTTDTLARMRLPEGIGDNPPDDQHTLLPARLISGVHLWPGFWIGSGYGQLLHVLRRHDPGQVVSFAYDWRLSNRLSALKLKHTIESALSRWRQHPGRADAKVSFVCHSMGGLIAHYYLDILGGADTCRRIITIGTPYSGSIKAIRALTGGLVPRIDRIDRALVEVARTFPSVHQLLPSYHCVDVPGTSPETLNNLDIPDLPSAAVADGLSFHDELSAARRNPPTYEEHFFAGKNQPTDQSITRTAYGLACQRTQRGQDHGGDGTVPYFSSVPADIPNTAAANYYSARHSSLQTHKHLLDLVIDKIDAIDHGAVLTPPHDLALDLPDIVITGQETPITVMADEPDLFLHAHVTALDGTIQDHHIPLHPHGNRTYTAHLDLPPGTWRIAAQTVNDVIPAHVEDILIVTPPT